MGGFKDELAWLLYDLWADEMSFIVGKYIGDSKIPDKQELVDKINSSYDDLSEEDKKHFEDMARRVIWVFKEYLERQI